MYFYFFFFFNDTATTEIYTLSLHDALPISAWHSTHDRLRHDLQLGLVRRVPGCWTVVLRGHAFERRANASDRRGRSEEHTSELQSLAYLVCRLLLEKKK